MAVRVIVTTDEAQLKRVSDALEGDRRAVFDVVRKASTRSANVGRTFVGRQLRKELNIKKGDLERTAHGRSQPLLFVTRVKEDSGRQSAFSKITLSEAGRPPLKLFDAQQLKSGVSYEIKPRGGRSRAAHAFGPNIPKLKRHVFVRTKEKTRAKKGIRRGRRVHKILKLYGASPWGAFIKRNLGPEAQRVVAEKFKERVEHELTRELARRRGRNA